MPKILLKVRKADAKLTIETEGFIGTACLDATKKLEEGLGLQVTESADKPEMHMTESGDQQLGQS